MKTSLLPFLILAVATGCQSAPPAMPAKPFLLDEHFDGFAIQVEFSEYMTRTTPKPGEDTVVLRAKLVEYLQGDTNHVQTHFMHHFQNLTPPLRERDFWALALARLTQTTLAITTFESDEAREQDIAELLMIVSMPRVELGQVSIEGPLQHNFKISTPDVERYIQEFGSEGYLAGLSDERTIEQASPNYTAPQQRQAGSGGISFQVSDLFLWYYLKEHPNSFSPVRFDLQDERAVAKSRALNEVRTQVNG